MRSTFRSLFATLLLFSPLLVQGASLNPAMLNPAIITPQGLSLHAPGPVRLASSSDKTSTSDNPSNDSPPATSSIDAPSMTLKGRPNWNPLWGIGPVIPPSAKTDTTPS